MKCNVGSVKLSDRFLLSLVLSATTTVGMVAEAVQLANGKTYFEQPPSLLGASVTHNSTYFPGAIYSFTLAVPAQAGEPLGSVMIKPEPSADYVRFELAEVEAYEGTTRRDKVGRAAKAVESDSEPRSITVTFDPPVAPGKSVTIALRSIQNPRYDGVYLYGVTAFPVGEQPYGQFLGFGRINIYGSVDSSFLYQRRHPFGW